MMSEKKSQVLQLKPSNELVFKGAFNAVITSNLVLANPSSKTVLFKVKTTAPKQYCVRPNSGILQPENEQTIAVMLQPSSDLATVDKSKHKFMVQSMFAPADFSPDNLDQLWKGVSKMEIMDSKLKCSFLEETVVQQPNKEVEATDQRSVSVDGAGESAVTSTGRDDLYTSVTSSVLASDTAAEETKEPLTPNFHPSLQETAKPPQPPPVISFSQPSAGSTPAHISAPKEASKESAKLEAVVRTLEDKVDKLTAENNQLKSETNKLRQRVTQKPAVTASIPPSIAPQSPSSPLNIIAILLILVALVLGYLVGNWL